MSAMQYSEYMKYVKTTLIVCVVDAQQPKNRITFWNGFHHIEPCASPFYAHFQTYTRTLNARRMKENENENWEESEQARISTSIFPMFT